MRRELFSAVAAIAVFTVLTGGVYPLVVTGVAQVAGGTRPQVATAVRGDALFHPRPSGTDYATDPSAFANRGPNQASARAFYAQRVAAYIRREGRYTPGLRGATVPIDAVTSSASGIDPGISIANARIQARRVAAVRGLPVARVQRLVAAHTDGRFLGVFGERAVDVPVLNRALEALR